MKKKPACPIPESQYERYKYRLEEKSGEFIDRNLMVFYIGVATGYRSQDIVGLLIGDLKEALENERFIIQESKQYNAWKTHMLKYPKSKKKQPPMREALIKPKLYKMIKEYIKNKRNSQYAFPSNKGDAFISAKSFSDILKKVGEDLGIKNISGHSMRKTYANRLWEAKRDLEYVRIALGHTNIETTKRYLGLNDEVKEDSAEITDDKL